MTLIAPHERNGSAGDSAETGSPPVQKSHQVRLTPEAFLKHRGGVRRCAIELLGALRDTGANVSVAAPIEQAAGYDLPPASALVRGTFQAREAAHWTSQQLGRSRGVTHSLYYDWLFRSSRWPLVVTVYDMAHELFNGGGKGLPVAKRLAIRGADVVITPSEATKFDILRLYPSTTAEIVSVPLGVSEIFLTRPKSAEPVSIAPFLLYVGRRGQYKNCDLLIRTVGESRGLADLRLVLVGGEPIDDVERQKLVDALGTDERLLHLPSPGDDELANLYDRAAALVVTSRCEGFGFPVLEAMSRGCPVACASGGSLDEVAAGHAAIFASDSVEACAEAIQRAIALPTADRMAAMEYARGFTWERTALAHSEVYCSIAGR